jgi:hypothetical protein
MAQQNVGRINFTVSNFGRYGTESIPPFKDCFTGERCREAEYPKGSNTIYLYNGGLWVGAVVDDDTLVSATVNPGTLQREFHPDEAPFGQFIRRSTLSEDEQEREEAVSEQDLISTYTDTFVFGVSNPSFDPIDVRMHDPLGLEVTQRSYGWSFGYADDMVLFDYSIRNVGDYTLKDVYFGFFIDGDAALYAQNLAPRVDGAYVKGSIGGDDDVTGIIRTWPFGPSECDFEDTLNVAWTADNDGQPRNAEDFEVPNVLGFRMLRTPEPGQRFSFNWWVPNNNPNLDFGPQRMDNFRNMAGVIGTPLGDRNKYFMMSNGEVDYDQIEALKIKSNDSVWLFTPNRNLLFQIAQGGDTRYIYSVGPFEMRPGEVYNIPAAIVGAEAWHTYQYNVVWNIRNAYRPDEYYENVNLKHLVDNARWAGWIYDNPGVDTDGDGYAGRFTVCVTESTLVDNQWVPSVAETTYYQGDGHADWVAASPPPPPKVWVRPTLRGIHVRWNGYRSETTKDVFSNVIDFEGYRVYFARDNRDASYTMASSYDRENFDKFVLVRHNGNSTPMYELEGLPYTLDELRCLYGNGGDPCNDPNFDPLRFTPGNPYIMPEYPLDSFFYFLPHDYNTALYGVNTGIRKIYPDEPPPGPGPGPEAFTDDGYLKYYEYEYTIEELLASVPYYVTVTAFDFGSPESDLLPLESSRTLDPQYAYPAASSDQLGEVQPDVYVYPNPYIGDGAYVKDGFEGRNSRFTNPDRMRQVTFVNLPPKCTISIFSLDGDLVRRLDHDKDISDPTHDHDTWDLISRNTQIIVTGIYYWTVEDRETGRVQIGKLVVIF